VHQYQLPTIAGNTSWHIGEVQFFFLVTHESHDVPGLMHTRALAAISVWSKQDTEIWRDSNHTVWFSRYTGQEHIHVMDVKDIDSCVAMVPHTLRGKTGSFLVEKPGLGAMGVGDYQEDAERGDAEVDAASDTED
jgi:hypothetical protein